MEYVSFAQILPGASSTQVITLIGFKRGGIPLAVLTLLIWVFPACFIMGLFSFLVSGSDSISLSQGIFKFIQPMAIGFLVFAGLKAFKIPVYEDRVQYHKSLRWWPECHHFFQN